MQKKPKRLGPALALLLLPACARVPAGIPAATVLSAAEDLAGQAGNSRLTGVKIDGVTLLPYLQNKTHPTPRRWAYAEQFNPNWNSTGWERTIRNGDFALIERQDGTRDFYNIAVDPLETTDILGRTRTTWEQTNLDELDAALDALIATR